jgi:hypothetical protein
MDNLAKGGNYERMFYSAGIPAWHTLGKVSNEDSLAEEVVERDFAGAFTTETRPITIWLNGENQETGDFAVVRSPMGGDPNSKELVFGYCTDRYKPLQPIEIARVFDKSVGKYVETMGFLGNGNDMFISWKMPEFEVTKGDVMQLYGIIRSGFDTLKGTSLFTSTYRPVCENTINLAQNWAKSNTDGKGKGEVWNGKHVNKNLLRDLGFWASHVVHDSERSAKEIQEFFTKLSNTPVKNDEKVKEILWYAFPDTDALGSYYPAELRGAKEKAISGDNEKVNRIRTDIFEMFAGRGTAITPTLYGVMNATSEYFCHILPSKKAVAGSIMFGNRQQDIMRVVNVLKNELQVA